MSPYERAEDIKLETDSGLKKLYSNVSRKITSDKTVQEAVDPTELGKIYKYICI
jgi:hypothetical protein